MAEEETAASSTMRGAALNNTQGGYTYEKVSC